MIHSCMKTLSRDQAHRVRGKFLFWDFSFSDWHFGWRTINSRGGWRKKYPMAATMIWRGFGPLDLNYDKRLSR